MANAKKCDRCGNYYDANAKYAVGSVLCNTNYISGISTLKSIDVSCVKEPDTIYDLCDKCLESFYDWFECDKKEHK